MAITKFISQLHSPKSGYMYAGVKRLLDYILNSEKTEGNRYVGSLNCGSTAEKVLKDMIGTKKYFGKESRNPHDRLAYHWTLSWSPDENITETEALRITQEFCEQYFGENYEVVFAVHNDKDHIHTHICFNSVNRINGYKYRYNIGDWAKSVQTLVDKICLQYGYHTLEMDTGMTLTEYYREHIKPKAEKNNTVRRNNCKYHKEDGGKNRTDAMAYIKEDIDKLILETNSYDKFLSRLEDMGYFIRKGKYLTLSPKGCSARVRTYQIGEEYTVDAIKERIAQPKSRKEELKQQLEKKNLVSYADAERNIKMEYLFSFRLQHMMSIHLPLTQYQKRNYYRMFRYSVKRAGKHMSYSQINKSLRNIRKLEEEMDMADMYSIESLSQIKDIRDAMYQSLENLEGQDKKVVRRQIGILWRMEKNFHGEIPSDIDDRVNRIIDVVNSDKDRTDKDRIKDKRKPGLSGNRKRR